MSPVTHNRIAADLAVELLTMFGGDAAHEAHARGDYSRRQDNVTNFIRWRSVERLLRTLTGKGDAITRQ